MKRRWWVALFLFSLTTINYIDRVALSLAAAPVRAEFHLTPVQLGYLFSSFLWTYTLGLIPMGMLVDRFGPKRIAGLGLALWSVATALAGGAWSLGTLLTTRLTMGLGEATTNPGGARVIREWFPATERGTANAIFNSGAFAGPAICAVAVGALLDRVGWRFSFIIAGALGLIWFLAWQFFYGRPEQVSWLAPAERDEILAGREMRSASLASHSGTIGLLAILSTRTMWGLAIAQGTSAYCSYLFLSWLPSYLQATKHLSISGTGLLTALPYAAAMIFCILIGRLSDRFLKAQSSSRGRRRFVVATSMLSAAITIMCAPFVNSTPLLLLLLAIALTGIATNTSQLFALLSDLLPDPRNIGKAMSIMVVGGNLFGLLAPIVTGYVVDATGSYNGGFVIASLLMLAGATVCLVLANRPMHIPETF